MGQQRRCSGSQHHNMSEYVEKLCHVVHGQAGEHGLVRHIIGRMSGRRQKRGTERTGTSREPLFTKTVKDETRKDGKEIVKTLLKKIHETSFKEGKKIEKERITREKAINYSEYCQEGIPGREMEWLRQIRTSEIMKSTEGLGRNMAENKERKEQEMAGLKSLQSEEMDIYVQFNSIRAIKEKKDPVVDVAEETGGGEEHVAVNGLELARSRLKCPVCLERMKPPSRIWMCPQTHLVCQDCQDEMENDVCPTCWSERVTGRAFQAENMARALFGCQSHLFKNTYLIF